MKGVYRGSQRGATQFICAYRSGSVVWFLGTDYTVGTPKYITTTNYKGINNDSLNWSDACACTWTVYLYLKSGTIITAENCKIPTQSEALTIDRNIRNNGFIYWVSTKYNDSQSYTVNELGDIGYLTTTLLYSGVVPLAKVSL